MEETGFGTCIMPCRRANILAAACAAFFALVYLALWTVEDWAAGKLEPRLLLDYSSAHVLVATMVGAAISSLQVFPRLGRRFGLSGIIRDLGWIGVAIVWAAILGGTLVFPGLGTVGLPVYLYLQTTSSLLSASVLAVGAGVALMLSRSRRHGGYGRE